MTQNKLHSSDERRACSENSEISPRTDTQHTSSQSTTNAVDQSANTTSAQTVPPELSEPPAHPKSDVRAVQQHMPNTQNTAPNTMNSSTQHNNASSTKTVSVSQETSTLPSKSSSKSTSSTQNSAPAEAYSIDQFPQKIT